MTIDLLNSVIPVILAISLASERLVTILKTAFPWLAQEKTLAPGQTDPQADRSRRLLVQGLAVATAYVTTGWFARSLSPLAAVPLGTSAASAANLPVCLVALLASSGSALWSNLLGYTKAVKDSQAADQAMKSMSLQEQARRIGMSAPAAAARPPGGYPPGANPLAARGVPGGKSVQQALGRMGSLAPPDFTLPKSRL
ncbi:MAG TPA: hypothetical protein VMS93_09640 [Candidatus Saccharimonadales bacterium]|nr:hypothetical protein [Candidatus Saccharimonadales bacterium]